MKAILLHIYGDTGLDSRLQAAMDLVRAFDGHLTCLHTVPFEDYLAVDPLNAASLGAEFSDEMARRREGLKAKVEARLRSEGMSWDWLDDDRWMADSLIRHSALADVIVVSRVFASLYRDEPPAVAGPVATAARAPVLAVPPDLTELRLDAPAVVAWNASPEAAVAVRQALPLLMRAPKVHLLTIEEHRQSHRVDAAERYLASYGVTVERIERPRLGSIGASLAAAAEELSAGLLVMGAYGHSRLRELLLGGVTRELLEDSPVPLLLGH